MADPEPDTRNRGRMDGRTDRQTDGRKSQFKRFLIKKQKNLGVCLLEDTKTQMFLESMIKIIKFITRTPARWHFFGYF